MSKPSWQGRDPDLGRERGGKFLGRRDWGWFTSYDTDLAERSTAEIADLPWGRHAILGIDRNDRTIGIPDRQITMWPRYGMIRTQDHELTLSINSDLPGTDRRSHREQVSAIVDELLAIPARPDPPDLSPTVLSQVLGELAPLVYGRSPARQATAISELANRYEMPTATLMRLATKTGELITRTTHRPATMRSGIPALNRLLDANLERASELLLAKATLSIAVAYSDPDLPRLWTLANALHHATPAAIITTQPGRSHGPGAAIIPMHDDLVGWRGIRTAVEQLQTTVEAANAGREWMLTDLPATGKITGENRFITLGVLQLTSPAIAHELSLIHSKTLDAEKVRRIATRSAPQDISDLSDQALKAVCQRNNWLLGTHDERTQRELIERHVKTALDDGVRTYLANGDTRPLTQALVRHSPTDAELDHAAWRNTPPSDETSLQTQRLDLASRAVIHHFTGLEIKPHESISAAMAARFPDRISAKGLSVNREALLNDTPMYEPPGTALSNQDQLDFGL